MRKTFTDKEIQDTFDSFTGYTDGDVRKVMDNQEKIERIASSGKLQEYLADIKIYFQMLGDFFTGKYKKLPVGTIAAIVGSLLYLLSPFDLIPDFIPVIGYLDDAAVLTLCLKFTRLDMEEYKQSKVRRSA